MTDSVIAYWAAVASQAAYLDTDRESLPLLEWLGAENVFHFSQGNCQGVIVEWPELTIIAIRGTTYEDILSDLHMRMTPGPFGHVHSGFLAYSAQAIDVIREYADLSSGVYEKPIILAGHSLGGAAAVLLSAMLGSELGKRLQSVQTFGCPRIGNAAFQAEINRMGCPHHRYVNANDGVAYVPWMLGIYCHTGVLHYFTTAGELWHDPNPIAVFLNRWGWFRRSAFRWATDKIGDHRIDRYVTALRKAVSE